VDPLLDHRPVQILLGVVCVLGVIGLLSLGGSTPILVLAIIVASLYVIAGMIVGAVWANKRNDPDYGPLRPWAFAGTLPALIGYGVERGLIAYTSSPERVRKTNVVLDKLGVVVICLLVAVAVFSLAMFAITQFSDFLIVVGIFAAAAVLVSAVVFASSYLKAKHAKSVEARTTYVDEEVWPGYTLTKAVVEPSKFAKFIMGIGDFLTLAFQVIRVKKWKICPIVEIPNE
jgi:hypothetical protein